VLLVGAGLLLRSFLRILDVDLGFEPSRAASISLDYNDGGKSGQEKRLLARGFAPGGGDSWSRDSGHHRQPADEPESKLGHFGKGQGYRKKELEATFVYVVSPGYLNAIGMHLVKGRDIRWDDTDKKVGVVIINETIARRLWPGEDRLTALRM